MKLSEDDISSDAKVLAFFKREFESKSGKIFNFFPTEEEIKAEEDRKKAEAQAKAEQEEQQRKARILSEEESGLQHKILAGGDKLLKIRQTEDERLEHLSG